MFIRIGGVPGVGKTTVIKKLIDAGKMCGLPVERVKGGDYLLKLAGVSSYEELRKLPELYRASLRPEMYRLMYEEDRRSSDIIRLRDAHFSLIDLESGNVVVFPLMPEDKEQMLNMVVLTADPEVILKRRLKDGDRSDRTANLETIIREQNIEVEEAMSQSRELGKELIIVDNSSEGLEVYKEIIGRAFPEGNIASTLEGAVFGFNGSKERFI